jgi:hypothetical protein
MAELGVGPPSLDRKALSADGLATAIAAMDNQRMRERARVISTLLRAEDGIAAAVSFVEKNCPAAVSERSLMGMSPLHR